MANDSSTGGYLLPADSPAPLEDLDLDKLFQELVKNITALPGTLVRPRWQLGNPKQPEPTENWCAVAVMSSTPDDNPVIEHVSEGEGYDRSIRHESLVVLTSFYGPRGKWFAGVFRDGLFIAQNREALTKQDIGLIGCGPVLKVPALVNQQWVLGYDMQTRFNRRVVRNYEVRNVLAADIHLFDDSSHVDERIEIRPPPA